MNYVFLGKANVFEGGIAKVLFKRDTYDFGEKLNKTKHFCSKLATFVALAWRKSYYFNCANEILKFTLKL